MAVTETWKEYATEAVFLGTFTIMDTFYVGLGTASFAIGSGDTAVNEITGAGYARQAVQWSDFVSDMSNTNTVVFAVGAAWPPVGYVFIADSSQGGRVILYDSHAAKTVAAGDTISINVGGLVLT